MHDWTLIDLVVEWSIGTITVHFRDEESRILELKASGLTHLEVPRRRPWGPSVSVNEIRGPTHLDGRTEIEIEMQSGDVIVIAAQSIDMPMGSCNPAV